MATGKKTKKVVEAEGVAHVNANDSTRTDSVRAPRLTRPQPAAISS